MTITAVRLASPQSLGLQASLRAQPPVQTQYCPPYHPDYPQYPNPYQADNFRSVTSALSAGSGGGYAAYKFGGQMAGNMKGLFGNGFKGFFGSMKEMGMTGLRGMGVSALVGAGVSAIGNGIGAATGQINSSEAVSNVVGDTITSAVGGLGAVTFAGVGHIALGRLGMAGTPLMIATVALGAIGGVVAAEMKDSILN